MVRVQLKSGILTRLATFASSHLGSAAWALADQAFFAISNFALNILLARALTPKEYGIYNVGFSLVLLASVIHNALLSEPMLVFGPVKYVEKLSSYLRYVAIAHWVSTGTLAAIAVGVGVSLWAAGSSSNGSLLVSFAIYTPLLLFQWLMRRSSYVFAGPKLAGQAGALYLVGAAITLAIIFRLGAITIPISLYSVGLNSLIAGCMIYARCGGFRAKASPGLWASIRRDHWIYGRWALAAALADFFTNQFLFLLIPLMATVAVSGQLRALANPVMPANLTISAVGLMLRPQLVRARQKGTFTRTVLQWTGLLTVLTTTYWIFISVIRNSVMDLLYKGRYTEQAAWLAVIALNPVLISIAEMFSAALSAKEQPNHVFRANTISSAASIISAIVLVPYWGVGGAVVALLAGSLARICSTVPLTPWHPGDKHEESLVDTSAVQHSLQEAGSCLG